MNKIVSQSLSFAKSEVHVIVYGVYDLIIDKYANWSMNVQHLLPCDKLRMYAL